MSSNSPADLLEQWVRNQPGAYLHRGLHIAASEGENGVHWHASEGVDAGTRIITIPHSIALSYLNALADDKYPVFKQHRKDLRVETIGYLYLALQYLQRSKSFWKPYLDTLPSPEDGHTTPLWIDDPADEVWLADTDALYTMKQRRAIYEEQYEKSMRILSNAGVDISNLTWDIFRWAITMYTSRAFSSRAIAPADSKYWTTYKTGLDGRRQTVLMDMSHEPADDLDFPVLFPGMDASNHDHDAKVDWSFDPGRFSLACTEGVVGGEQVYNNYGPKGNDELLLGYGFCIPDNPFDTVMLTLKPPPEELQQTLRQTHSGYFAQNGTWCGDKATFRLRRMPAPETFADMTNAFDQLPDGLLDLLTQIVRFDRGLPFEHVPDVVAYLKSPGSHGRRYLPFIARMIVTSLAPKYQKLQATSATLPPKPHNGFQTQSEVYRDSQIEILEGTINGLKAALRILRPAYAETSRLVTLGEAVTLMDESMSRDFLAGIRANARTSDIEQLRLAGWEEDTWVLLLCYASLWTSSQPSEGTVKAHIAELEAEYDAGSLMTQRACNVEGEASHEAGDLMNIVKIAAERSPDSIWADKRWSERFIAGFGGRVLKNESFMMMVPNEEGVEEPRLVIYLHGR